MPEALASHLDGHGRRVNIVHPNWQRLLWSMPWDYHFTFKPFYPKFTEQRPQLFFCTVTPSTLSSVFQTDKAGLKSVFSSDFIAIFHHHPFFNFPEATRGSFITRKISIFLANGIIGIFHRDGEESTTLLIRKAWPLNFKRVAASAKNIDVSDTIIDFYRNRGGN